MDGNFRKEVIDRSLDDIKVELDEEFDRNFERKSFFDEQKWPERKFDDGDRKSTRLNSSHSV